MAEFDIQQFEDRVTDLINTCQRLSGDNRQLREECESLSRHNAEIKERLQGLVERLRALEDEAEAQQP